MTISALFGLNHQISSEARDSCLVATVIADPLSLRPLRPQRVGLRCPPRRSQHSRERGHHQQHCRACIYDRDG